MNTNIRAWGNSQGIYIPKKVLNELGLSINDSVKISVDGDRLVIQKDDSASAKRKAWESIQAIREKHVSSSGHAITDYRKELEEYLDEKYGY